MDTSVKGKLQIWEVHVEKITKTGIIIILIQLLANHIVQTLIA